MHSAPFLELQLMAMTKHANADTVTYQSNIDRTESTDETDSASIESIEPSTSLSIHQTNKQRNTKNKTGSLRNPRP